MATRLNPQARVMLDRFLARFEQAILERIGPAAGKAARGGAGPRMCPVPGCPNTSAGPRNRFFCSDHARSLGKAAQDRILAVAHREAAQEAASNRTAVANGRRKRRGPRGPLDMRCRVEGCKNLSRGPRFGFICDDHRKSLGKKQQAEAREKYKAKRAAAKA